MADGPPTTPREAAALLDWYAAMGVDVAISESPIDRFAEAETRRAASPQPDAANAPVQRQAPLAAAPAAPFVQSSGKAVAPTDATVRDAVAAARAANTLDELRAALASFEGCNLRLTARSLVFSDGNPDGRVMMVGEAPGREEDLEGLAFVGRSGQLLDRMLAAIGLSRANDVYIANVVPWRPPGNRTPTPQETATCRPFIERQIELAKPDILICLGAASAREILGTTEGILRLRGKWRDYDAGGRKIRAMATLHPAYLLRQPLQKRLAWQDFMMIRTALDG